MELEEQSRLLKKKREQLNREWQILETMAFAIPAGLAVIISVIAITLWIFK